MKIKELFSRRNTERPAEDKAPPAPAAPHVSLPTYIPVLEGRDGKVIYTSHISYMKSAAVFDTGSAPRTLPGDIVISRCLAQYISALGYELHNAVIGGGVNEISHTGDVAYGARYSSLDEFIGKADADYLKAEDEAAKKYGSWFSALSYSYIIMDFKKPGVSLKVDWGNCISFIFEPDGTYNCAEDLCSIHEYLFEARNETFGDTLRYDKTMRKLRQTLQLDGKRLCFLSTFITENGLPEKKTLDIELADDRHYEFSPAAEDDFAAALTTALGKAVTPLPRLMAYFLAAKGSCELESIAGKHCSAVFRF